MSSRVSSSFRNLLNISLLAVNKECDYSAAYVTLTTSDGLIANGMTFDIGRGNEVSLYAKSLFAQSC